MSSGRIRTSLHLCPPVTSGRGPGPLSTDVIIMKLSVGVEHVTGFVSKLFAAAMSDPAALTTAFILSSPSYSGLPFAVRCRSLSIPFRKHYSSSIHRSSWPFFNVPCSPCSSTSSWSSLYSSSTFSLPFCHLPIFQHWWKYSLTFDVFPDLLSSYFSKHFLNVVRIFLITSWLFWSVLTFFSGFLMGVQGRGGGNTRVLFILVFILNSMEVNVCVSHLAFW